MKEMSWKEYLPNLFSSFLYQTIRSKFGTRYGVSLYYKWLNHHKSEEWILKTEPNACFFRLWNKKKCSYCDNPPTNGIGDHAVGRKRLDFLFTHLPCCRRCNSSKGRLDLIYWFCIKKGNNILKLSKDVISIYVRAQYRALHTESRLDTLVPDEYITILTQLHKGLER